MDGLIGVAASCCCSRVGELRVVDPCLSTSMNASRPLGIARPSADRICRIHLYLLNRTDQFTWDSGLKEPHVGSPPYF